MLQVLIVGSTWCVLDRTRPSWESRWNGVEPKASNDMKGSTNRQGPWESIKWDGKPRSTIIVDEMKLRTVRKWLMSEVSLRVTWKVLSNIWLEIWDRRLIKWRYPKIRLLGCEMAFKNSYFWSSCWYICPCQEWQGDLQATITPTNVSILHMYSYFSIDYILSLRPSDLICLWLWIGLP